MFAPGDGGMAKLGLSLPLRKGYARILEHCPGHCARGSVVAWLASHARERSEHGAVSLQRLACLTILLGALGAPAALLAQQSDDIDLVLNDDGIHGTKEYLLEIHEGYQSAQRFATGSNSSGYVLSEVGLWFRRIDQGGIPLVTIHQQDRLGPPGPLLYTLANPATLENEARNNFPAPENAVLLPDRGYSVRVSAPDAAYSERFVMAKVLGSDETGAAGWSISDSGFRYSSTDGGITWETGGSVPGVHAMRIRGRLNELDESAVTADAVQLTSSGAYYTDNVIEATVSFSEAVDVTGTPTLALQIGENSRPAVYDSGGGSSELVFSYTVVEGDRDANGVSVLLNALAAPAGASIAKQGSNTNAVLNVLPGLLDEQVHKVNTGPAILLRRGIQFTSRPATAGGDTYGLGETIEITVTFDEPAIVDTAGGVPTFKIQMGHDDTGESRTAVYARGSGSAELVFGYDVQSGDRDINGVSALSNSLELNSGTIRNAAGFDAFVEYREVSGGRNHKVDGGSNQRPTADDSSVTTEEDTPYTFQADDFNFSDDDTGDMFDSVTLVTLPADGALTLDIAAVIAGAVVPVTQIGMLVYTPEENEFGTDEFNFRVSDGNHESADDYTMTVTVTRVDDPATGAPTISGTAQVGETLTADTSTIEDVDVIGGTPTSFSYRWIRVDDGTEAPIAGATGKNYFLALADAGKKIKVEVSYKQDLLGDPTATLTSEAFPETGTIDGSGVEEVTAVCDRTGAVRDAIVAAVPRVNDCANVTSAQLVAITGQLNLVGAGITELAEGDFSGLRALNSLLLNNNNLSTLPAGLFDGLTALQYLYLNSNAEMRTLPAGIFDSLSALEYLHLHNNRLNQLPAGLFDELVSLKTLDLSGNRLRQTGTNALPDGIFELLTALTTLDMSGQGQGRRFNPVADAVALDGKVSSAGGGTVRLDGSGSGGPWGTNVTYEWALTNPANGLMVEFDDHTGDSPRVTIPAWHAGSVLTFTLTVSVSVLLSTLC